MANRIMLNETSYHGAGAVAEVANEAKARGLKKALLCRYAYCRLPITHPRECVTDLGFGELTSRDLEKNLVNCREAFLLAVTLGAGVDRLLLRLSRLSPARHFVTDALASALAARAFSFSALRAAAFSALAA